MSNGPQIRLSSLIINALSSDNISVGYNFNLDPLLLGNMGISIDACRKLNDN